MTFSPSKVLSLRNKIIDSLYGYAGAVPVGNSLQQMAIDIHSVFPDSVDVDSIFCSISYLAGTELSEEAIKTLAWRLAGNLNKLKEGRSVLPWTSQKEEEWVPFQFIRGCKVKKGYLFNLKALSGSICPQVIIKLWPDSFCSLVSRELGSSAPWGKYPISNYMEFVGMRILGLLEPDKCKDRPDFDKIKCTPGLITWNRSMIKMRNRDDFTCPENYDIPCYLCWHGQESCPSACRPLDLVPGHCDNCEEQGWFELNERDQKTCQSCGRQS